ncbi:ImmA/IrrE family metallo-endopeptidase [Fusobacterium varium]|uniref:ImmA/IrrE family metallo-endopeptidase n=1 Tax=Fusobacterium varium TaxID=856 RepID=UPI00204F19A5|nr:ImmA/IrrE family metallo-endopeptidase [Fusobacterium varium]DAE89476.1 MAG TPA: IrrE protein [Caudoviricetes sp.]
MIKIDPIYKTVEKLKQKYRTSNPIIICKKLGIDIKPKKLNGLNGYFISCLKKKYIIVNENLSDEVLLLVIAHELGHAILHSSRSLQYMRNNFLLPRDSNFEKEADLFAILLLGRDFYIANMEYTNIRNEKLDDLIRLSEEYDFTEEYN